MKGPGDFDPPENDNELYEAALDELLDDPKIVRDFIENYPGAMDDFAVWADTLLTDKMEELRHGPDDLGVPD